MKASRRLIAVCGAALVVGVLVAAGVDDGGDGVEPRLPFDGGNTPTAPSAPSRLPEDLRVAVRSALLELCNAITIASDGQQVSARERFYNASHEQLHAFLEWLAPVRPDLAAPLETSKNELEVTLGYLFQGRDPIPGFEAVAAASRTALAAVDEPAASCT